MRNQENEDKKVYIGLITPTSQANILLHCIWIIPQGRTHAGAQIKCPESHRDALASVLSNKTMPGRQKLLFFLKEENSQQLETEAKQLLGQRGNKRK